MKAYVNPLRISAVLMVLFCLGHSTGALISTPQFGIGADAVATGMRGVHFDAQGSDCTWWGFYLGFGWTCSIFFLLTAGLCWFVGGRALDKRRELAPIVWMLLVAYVANTFLAWRFFFIVPQVLSTLVTLLVAVECWRLNRAT